jgi:hypothetical protein
MRLKIALLTAVMCSTTLAQPVPMPGGMACARFGCCYRTKIQSCVTCCELTCGPNTPGCTDSGGCVRACYRLFRGGQDNPIYNV